MSGDNFHIDVVNNGPIEPALAIAFRGQSAVGYALDPKKGLIFFWAQEDGATPFPFKMDAAGAADFVTRWLKEADYGREPDHDGDNGRGWRVYTESWGRVGDSHRSICAVKPAWIMFGK